MVFVHDIHDAIAATSVVSAAIVATPNYSRCELMRLGDGRSTAEIEELGRQWREQGLSLAGTIGTDASGETHIALNRPAPVEQLHTIERAFHEMASPSGDAVAWLERLWLESEDPR